MLRLSFLAAMLALSSCLTDVKREPPSPRPATSPATQPASAPAARDAEEAAPAVPPALDPELDQLLTRLEANAVDLTSFMARITYDKEDALLGRREVRSGEIIYRIEPEKKTFAVLFDVLVIIPPGRREERLQHYIFDGRWLAEVNHQDNQFIKREIVPPGEVLDPLKLGEGPFPLPIGQSKKDVLARFDVSRIDVPKEGMLKDLTNVDGVLLTPKPGTNEARDYQRVEIFYDRATLLPVGINAIETNDDRKTVKLTDLQRNSKLDEMSLKKLDIAEPDPKKWKVTIEPWRGQ